MTANNTYTFEIVAAVSDRSRLFYRVAQVEIGAQNLEDSPYQLVMYNVPTRPGWSRMLSYQVLRFVSLSMRCSVSSYTTRSVISVEACAAFTLLLSTSVARRKNKPGRRSFPSNSSYTVDTVSVNVENIPRATGSRRTSCHKIRAPRGE